MSLSITLLSAGLGTIPANLSQGVAGRASKQEQEIQEDTRAEILAQYSSFEEALGECGRQRSRVLLIFIRTRTILVPARLLQSLRTPCKFVHLPAYFVVVGEIQLAGLPQVSIHSLQRGGGWG